jgi:hypothetical protein
MKTLKIPLPDELYSRLEHHAEQAGADITAYLVAFIADVTAEIPTPPSEPPTAAPPVTPPVVPPVTPPVPRPTVTSSYPTFITSSPKGPQSDISLVVRWDSIDRGQPESIRKTTAAATLVRLIERMSTVLGSNILPRLTTFRVSRGPLVSRDPERDYLNRNSGAVYANHQIGNTGFYVLTHSSTDQKIQDLPQMLRHLNLPRKLLEITKHKKA